MANGADSGGVDRPSDQPATDYTPIDSELTARNAAAFVHVGDRFDDDIRYLTRFQGPDRPYGVCFLDEPVCFPPALFEADARETFPGEQFVLADDRHVAERIAEYLDERGVEGTILTPRSIAHDAAVYLEQAGFEIASTDVLDRMRRHKSAVERDRHETVQTAAQTGMDRARAVLRAAEIVDRQADPMGEWLHYEGALLPTERLRREVNAAMAAEGVDPAHNTVIGAGPSCADLHYRGIEPIAPDETVLLDLSPRGPDGYYGDFTRTFVPDLDDGWERRAHVAVENARDAAFAVLSEGAGVTASTVHREAAAEIAAYGFEPDGEPGFTHGLGHGVGLSLHEQPSLRADEELRVGDVVTVEPGVYDSARGGVRIEDLVVIEEDGFSRFGEEYPTSLGP